MRKKTKTFDQKCDQFATEWYRATALITSQQIPAAVPSLENAAKTSCLWQANSCTFNEKFRCSELIVFCSKLYCCYNQKPVTVRPSSKKLNQNNIEEPLINSRNFLFDEKQVYSPNRGFRVVDNKKVCTYEQKNGIFKIFISNRLFLVTDPSLSIAMEPIGSSLTNSSAVLIKL